MDHPTGGQVAFGWELGCVNAVSDALAASVVQLVSTTYAGANQINPAELLRDRGIDLSRQSDTTILLSCS